MHSRQEMKSSLLKFDSLGLNTFRYMQRAVCIESDFFSNLKASLVSHLLMSIMKTFYISLFRIFPPANPTLWFYHQWYLSARKNQYVFIEKHMCFTEEFEAFQAPQSVSSRCMYAVALWIFEPCVTILQRYQSSTEWIPSIQLPWFMIFINIMYKLIVK